MNKCVKLVYYYCNDNFDEKEKRCKHFIPCKQEPKTCNFFYNMQFCKCEEAQKDNK